MSRCAHHGALLRLVLHAIDVEDQVEGTTCLDGMAGQRFEEPASDVREARRTRSAVYLDDAVVAGVRINDECASRAAKYRERRLARAVWREAIRDDLVGQERPYEAAAEGHLHDQRRLVGLNDLGFADESKQSLRERSELLGGGMKQVGQRRPRHRDTEPMQRRRVGALGDGDVGQEARTVVATFDRANGRVGRRDEPAARARRLLLHVALTHEVARHVLVEVRLLPGAELTLRDAATARALSLVLAKVMDHGLAAKLVLERSALATALERCEPTRLGVLRRLVLAELLLRRRYLLRLGTEHAAGERFHGGRDGRQLAAHLVELGPQPFRFVAPGTAMIVGQVRHNKVGSRSGDRV